MREINCINYCKIAISIRFNLEKKKENENFFGGEQIRLINLDDNISVILHRGKDFLYCKTYG